MSDESTSLILPNEYQVRKETDKEREKFTDSQVKIARRMCKTNLFFLANTILNYRDLTSDLHGHLCSWLDRTISYMYRLVLLPRFHFKTTIVTIADSIQIALPDDTGMMPYPRNLGGNVRIGIFHEAADHAANFLQSIANHVLGNPRLLALYPEIRPGPDQRKNKTQLELGNRTDYWSEPTFEALGIGTKAQGRHYNVLKPDDIYGDAARDSEADHKRTIRWLNGIRSLTTNIKTDPTDFSGTRYKHDDVYQHIYKIYKPLGLKVYIQSVWKRDAEGSFLKDKNGHFIPIFPERISWESMQPIMADRDNYESNYLNDPASGTSEFQEEWFEYYRPAPHNHNKFIIDVNDEQVEVDLFELDRVIFIDPAPKGLTGITVTGTTNHRDYKILVLEAIEKSFTTDSLLSEVFRLAAKYKPRLVVFEEVNFSMLYAHIMSSEQSRRGIRFRVEGAKTKQKMKEDRVRGLVNYFANHRILLNPNHTEFIRTVRRFPGIKDYHALDSLAYGPSYWRRSPGSDYEEKRQGVLELLNNRDPLTGYSR